MRVGLSAGLLVLCLAAAPVGAMAAPDSSPLTLPERRGIDAYQNGPFPQLRQRIQDAAGFAVPVEVKWDAIAVRGESSRYADKVYWTDVYFAPIADALAKVGADAMGKQALKDRLKSIVILYDQDTAPLSAYEKGVTFEGGVLTINFQPGVNANDTAERRDAIVKKLEAGL